MSKPVGAPPSPEEVTTHVTQYLKEHSCGPFTTERASANHLIFTSEMYPLQFELMFDDELAEIEYTVSETPKATGETLSTGTQHTNIPDEPATTWANALDEPLMAISGAMTGATHKGVIEPRE